MSTTVEKKNASSVRGLGSVIRIVLSSFDTKLLERVASLVSSEIRSVGGSVSGPIPIPNDIKKITVNRSHQNDRRSMEQFQISKSKRLVVVENISSEITEHLSKIDLPPGVDAEIKLKQNNS